MATGIDGCLRLKNICSRLRSLGTIGVDIFQKNFFDKIRDVTRLTCRLSGALTEVKHDLNIFGELQKRRARETPITEVEGYLEKCNALKDDLLRIQDAVEITPLPALRKGE